MSHWEATPIEDESTEPVFEPIEVVETLSQSTPSSLSVLIGLAAFVLVLVTPAIVVASYKAAF